MGSADAEVINAAGDGQVWGFAMCCPFITSETALLEAVLLPDPSYSFVLQQITPLETVSRGGPGGRRSSGPGPGAPVFLLAYPVYQLL